MKNEVRPIDANALARKIREYMEDFQNAKTRLATCRVVLSMLGDEGQTPTLTDHFPDLTKMMPLTLEQLKEMDGQPVWVHVIDHTIFADKKDDFDGWGMCLKSWVRIWDSKRADIVHIDYDFEDYGKDWIAYAYHPAHIDREAWEPCAKCVGCGNCYYFLYDDDEYPCNKCLKESTDKNQYPKFEPIGFCKHCGRPLTDEPGPSWRRGWG